MRLALDARMIRITGPGRYIQELSTQLYELGVKNTLLISPKDEDWLKKHFPKLKYLIVPEPIYSWSEQLLMPARLKKEAFDLIHFANFNVPVVWRDPCVITLHDLIPLTFSGERRKSWISKSAYRKVLKTGLGKARRVIVPSQSVKNSLRGWIETEKVKVIPHGLGDHFRREKEPWPKRANILRKLGVTQPYILYVGNYRSHKNITTLIQAFNAFKEEFPNVQLVLAGKISHERQQALTSLADHHIADISLIFTGEVTQRELIALYDSAKLFILPSFLEGFGLVALEAAARGAVVIASKTTPVKEFLGAQNFISFDPNSPQDLTFQLKKIWLNTALRLKLVKSAQAVAYRRTWREVALDTIRIYQEALKLTHKNHV